MKSLSMKAWKTNQTSKTITYKIIIFHTEFFIIIFSFKPNNVSK